MQCLVAPNELEGGGELEHVGPCAAPDGMTYAKLAPKGGTFAPAIAESPPGYARSNRGHAYQVKFDLLNRRYVGGSWSPTSQLAGVANGDSTSPFGFGRGRVEMGIEVSVPSPSGRSRHDFRILDASATFKDFELTGVLFAYDYQHRHRRPAFLLTSFIGEPRLSPPGIHGSRAISTAMSDSRSAATSSATRGVASGSASTPRRACGSASAGRCASGAPAAMRRSASRPS